MIRRVARRGLGAVSAFWPDYSRLILMRDGRGWAIDADIRAISDTARRLGVRTLERDFWQRCARRQSVFWGSQFSLLEDDWLRNEHRNATAVFHGLPGTGFREFDRFFERVALHRDRLQRIQVTHREMADTLAGVGVPPERIHRIPIAIDGRVFKPFGLDERTRMRATLGIPGDAFVIGSFQKDGNGWDEGNEPKLIKGPDLLVDACARVHASHPDTFVLLSGPARGYVKNGLRERGVPFVHRVCGGLEEVADLYAALDAYLVSSRQEGGPKAVLESMATGVPLVSTPVGQATDLVRDGENGFLVPKEDSDSMADALLRIARGEVDAVAIRREGFETAAENDYRALDDLWREFFAGFVE